MEIVIEYVLLDNMVMNMIIIYLSNLVLKQKNHKGSMIAASCFGTACAFFVPIISVPSYLLISIKLIIGLVMVLIAFRPKSIKTCILVYLVFFTFTAVLGGFSFAIIYLLSGSLDSLIFSIYNLSVPIGVIYLIIIAYVYLLCNAIKYFHSKRIKYQYIFDIQIENNGCSCITEAYLDSGNNLIDPVTNKPVLIFGYKTFSKLFSDISLEKILLKKISKEELRDLHYIKVETLSKQSEMLVFSVDKISIAKNNESKSIEKVVAGLSLCKFQKNFNCDVLLNPNLL